MFDTDYQYPLMKAHAPAHTWPGYDAPPIHKRQLLPGMVTATGLLVTCQSDFVLTDAGILAYFPGAQLDISSSVPTSGARYVLISINSSTLALTATEGSIVDYAALTYASIPSTPAGHKREAAIRLVAGQTAIRERDSGDTDILDLRFLDPNALLTSAQVIDLTDGGDSTLHYHATDRARANHTGTQTASTISDFATAVYSAAQVAPETNANDVYRRSLSGTNSSFAATIATLPGGADLTYTLTSGFEATIVVESSSQLAKVVLHNTTRGTSSLIVNTVIATTTITLTDAVPAGWQVGDTITVASQTLSGGSYEWFDVEIISGPTSKSGIFCFMQVFGTAGDTARIHPFDGTFATSKIFALSAQVTGIAIATTTLIKLNSNKFCLSWVGGPLVGLRENGYIV